jgi:hypothetical protein
VAAQVSPQESFEPPYQHVLSVLFGARIMFQMQTVPRYSLKLSYAFIEPGAQWHADSSTGHTVVSLRC